MIKDPRDPRINVILAHLNLVCKYYEYGCGQWCMKAYGSKEYNDQAKYVNCGGQISKCELTVNDRIKPDDKEFE